MPDPEVDPLTESAATDDEWEAFQVGPTVHVWMDRHGQWHREEIWPDAE